MQILYRFPEGDHFGNPREDYGNSLTVLKIRQIKQMSANLNKIRATAAHIFQKKFQKIAERPENVLFQECPPPTEW